MNCFSSLLPLLFLSNILFSQCPSGTVRLESQTAINNFDNNFPNCKIIEGDLIIGRTSAPTTGNFEINSLTPLSNIEVIKGDLQIGFNTNLNDLEGLENLKIIEGNAEIRGGFNTTSLKGLENLDSIGAQFSILATEIINMNNLTSLKYIGGSFIISGNRNLEEFSIPSLIDIGGFLSFRENENLERIKDMHHWVSLTGGLSFVKSEALNDLSGLSNLQTLGRGLTIDGTNNVNILPQLTSLDTINGSLFIIDSNVSEYTGLEWVKHIGGSINYIGNGRLTRLLRFDNVLNEVESIKIEDNRNLTSLDGLSVSQVTGDFEIIENFSLKDMNGLGSLVRIGGNFYIERCVFDNFNGLENLTSIENGLTLENNFAIASLNGLNPFVDIQGRLILNDNTTLSDISALANLNPNNIERLQLTNNSNLSECSIDFICDYLTLPGAVHFISNNADGCNEEQEIQCNGNRIRGQIFYDKNENKVFDSGDIGLQNAVLQIDPPGSELITDDLGNFSPLIADGETKIISPVLEPFWQLTTDSSSFTITQDPNLLATTTYNFGYTISTDVFESGVNIISEPTRCNERVRFYVQAINKANIIEEGVLKLKIDQGARVYSTNPQDSYFDEYEEEYIWFFSDLDASEIFEVELLIDMPSEQFLGEQLCYTASLCDISNGTEELIDTLTYKPIVLCSYDPNDKLVIPEGVGEENFISLSDTTLRYTIRFQNTGNDVAKNVSILDTLDGSLDLNTFEFVNSSHTPEIIRNGSAFEFRFSNIFLPDSVSNEKDSQGYITYDINANIDVEKGTVIENTAHIIFDANPPIVTNTTFNTFSDFSTPITEVDYVLEFDIYPNPVSHTLNVVGDDLNNAVFNIYDLFGKKKVQSDIKNINIDGLESGIYFLEVVKNEGRNICKFIKRR